MPISEVTEESVSFLSDRLRLEGVLTYPKEGNPFSAVLLLNPHPLLGGNMNNNVVCHIARRVAEEGGISLRFNYSGVGASEIHLQDTGKIFEYFDELEARQDYSVFVPDCIAAADYLRKISPSITRFVVAGYSLGTVLAPMLSKLVPFHALIAIGPPNRRVSLHDYEVCPIHKIFLAGDRDFVFDPEQFQRDYERFPEPKTFLPMPGCDHFFRGEEERVFQAIKSFLLPGKEERP